jgi:Flp pilus assembly protein TadG
MRRSQHGQVGQSLVEFSLAITVFLVILMGIVDLGRAAYQFNGVAEAARELARVTSVYPGATLGSSSQTAGVLATQRGLVPGLGTPTYTCVDVSGATVTGRCSGGYWVRVTLSSTFLPATPLATMFGNIVLTSAASAMIE